MKREYVIEHPNRHKASSKATRAVVTLLLLASATLFLIVAIGGWEYLVGAKAMHIFYIGVYLLAAFFVLRWNRGILPVIAALAIIMLIFAAVSTPSWFDRADDGYAAPVLPSDVLGTITAIIVPVQALLIVFAMRGFQQAWNVEVERYSDGSSRSADGTTHAAPAGA